MARGLENEAGSLDRDERLGEAIEEFLELAESGRHPDPEQFASGYPDLRDDLLAAIDGLELVRGLVGSSSGPGVGHGLESGRRVAGYKIVRELGRGGMGIVYEAVHVGLDRPVALKVLGTSAAPDSSSRRRFLNEARTAAALHHTHIVPVFDVGQVGGLCYYAMQRIEGSGLDRVVKHLRRDRVVGAGVPTPTARASSPVGFSVDIPIAADTGSFLVDGSTASWAGSLTAPPERRRTALDRLPLEPARLDEHPPFIPPRGPAYYRWVASVGKQAAEALAHAHQRRVIHRDVKPSNLLVDARGVIWMADFGLARRLADPSQTQADSLLGTPRYMSPEQTRGGPIDGRADIYSLGATLYELLTLRAPFDGKTAAELVEQITGRDPAHPRQFDKRIPLDLETIILKALAKRPEDRYVTASEFSDDLQRFLDFEPVKARRISPFGRAWRVARRHPSLTIVTTVALIAVTAAWTAAYFHVVKERDDAVRARQAAQASAENTRIANEETRRALRNQSYQQATLQRLSNVANRRAAGLGFIRDAAGLEPEPELVVQLRDEALELLSLRDVVPRQTFSAGGAFTLVALDENRYGLISDGEDGPVFRIHDARNRSTRVPTEDPFNNQNPRGDSESRGIDRGRNRGPSRGPFGLFPMFRNARVVMVGGRVAVLSSSGRELRLFDAGSGAVLGDISFANRLVLGLQAVPSGNRLITIELDLAESRGSGLTSSPNLVGPPVAGPDRPRFDSPRFIVNLWNPDHADAPLAVLASSRAETAASGAGGVAPPTFPGFVFPLVGMTPDGEEIAVGWLGSERIQLFDRDGRGLGELDAQVPVMSLGLGPNDLLAAAGDSVVQIWDYRTKVARATLTPRHNAIWQLRFSPDNRGLLAIGMWGGSVELWDISSSTAAPIAVLPTTERASGLSLTPSALVFTPSGRSLAMSHGETAAVWSVLDPVGQERIQSPRNRMSGVEFGPDGQLLLWSHEAPPRLWSEGDCPIAGGHATDLPASTAAMDADGNVISVDDRRIAWVDAGTGRVTRSVELPKPAAKWLGNPLKLSVGRSLARTPDGSMIVFTRGGEWFAWSASDPDQVREIHLVDDLRSTNPGPPSRRTGGKPVPTTILLSPSGDRIYCLIYSARNEAELRVFAFDEPRTGSIAHRVDVQFSADPRNKTSITTIAMSADGERLALARMGGQISVHSTRDFHVLSRIDPNELERDQWVHSLAFSPDGQTLAAGTREVVRLWTIPARGRARELFDLPGHRGNVIVLAFDSTGLRLASGDDKTTKLWNLERIRKELNTLGLRY
ncbi:MAG: WD40 repeat domain-containing serine/threonine-protein kinase [Isosphaeraceae bacterium]|nr:WD40 repeat domain-containing serine/threonine-protein kinase [Isosphaeraceae bacterium]